MKKAEGVLKHLGDRLRTAREAANLTQAELGAELGVSGAQIQKYEQGKAQINAKRLWRAALALHRPPDWFFEGLTFPADRAPVSLREIDAKRARVTDLISQLHKPDTLEAAETLLQALIALQLGPSE
ncbi:MAG: helix-turn-helix transcriptional regulator [Henriciella sp.]|nr:helix-turn-helix transcriptional regulator [Henriciella sp.]